VCGLIEGRSVRIIGEGAGICFPVLGRTLESLSGIRLKDGPVGLSEGRRDIAGDIAFDVK